MTKTERNWAGNHQYRCLRLHFPETVEQAQEIVARCRKIKALGSRHSFNNIADCTEDIISLEKLPLHILLNSEQKTVTISANIKYGQLGQYLHQKGFAVHNLASLPHISVVGACATATHGSGDKNGNLATAVIAMEMITANGELINLSRHQNEETFQGVVVSLGGLGIVTKITLDIVPTFDVRQVVYENLPLSRLADHFNDIMSVGYSVSLFTDWQKEQINQIWVKQLVTEETPEPTLFEATLAEVERHPIISISAENCTRQLAIPGPWHTRLPHFRMEFTPSSGDELQTEYFVARQDAYEALTAVGRLGSQIATLLQISEIRTIAADNLWMSPCYQQDSVAIHFTWKPDWPNVRQLLPVIEDVLAPFDVRPHWAKLFTIPPSQLKSRYQQLPNFQQLLLHHDPNGKFRNEFLDTYIFG
jgi:xylitol oxidase